MTESFIANIKLQIAKLNEMDKKGQNLSERLMKFAVEVIRLTSRLKRIPASRHIAGQLTRSATSAGANYEEACGAEGKKDFAHKLQIVLKELKESLYCLKLTKAAQLRNRSRMLPRSERSRRIGKNLCRIDYNHQTKGLILHFEICNE